MGIKLTFVRGDDLADEDRCIQHKKNGDRCSNRRMKGATVCGTAHGRDRKTKDAAHRRQSEKDQKMRALRKYEREGPVEIRGAADVISMLEDRLGVQVRMAEALDDIVGRLVAASELRYEHSHGEQLRGEVQAWIQLNQMVAKLGMDFLKIDIAGKRIQIEQAQAAVLLTVIRAILGRLDLTRDQKRLAVQVIPQEFERASIEQGGKHG